MWLWFRFASGLSVELTYFVKMGKEGLFLKWLKRTDMTVPGPNLGTAARRADRLQKNWVRLGSGPLMLTDNWIQARCLETCGLGILPCRLLIVSDEMSRRNRTGWLRAWALGLVLTDLSKPVLSSVMWRQQLHLPHAGGWELNKIMHSRR